MVARPPAPKVGRVVPGPDAIYVPTTVVVAVAVLFEPSGSLGLPVTVAVLLIVPGLVGLTTIVIVAESPLERTGCE
jgi:hypothetical protein